MIQYCLKHSEIGLNKAVKTILQNGILLFKIEQFDISYKMIRNDLKGCRMMEKSYIILSNWGMNGLVQRVWKRRSYMRKDMRRRLCVGVVAFFTAIAVMGGVRYSAFASDYHANEDSFEDEALVEETVDLSDTLQKGGLGISQPSGDVATLASTYDKDAFDARLVEAFKNYESSVDVSDIGITRDEAYNGGINTVINSHPEIIGIAGTSYYYSPSTNLVTKIVITYTSNAREEQQKLDAAINELNSRVDISGMTDEEIVLAYHEYLTSTVAYAYAAYLQGSLGGAHEYDMYGALVNHSSVCQGYAETMFYLLKKAGLSCAIASSQNINHAWNIVKVNGKWYHVDATWDDPVWDMPGRSNHDYFLVSFDTMNKNTLVNHTKDRTDMVVSAQWGDTYTSAIDTTYESGKFWNGVNKAILYKDGYWYSIGSGASDTGYQINKYQYSTGTNKVIYSGTAKWTAPSGGYYPGVYGSIYLHGNSLYFATPDSLKKIDLISAAASPVEILNIRTKYNSASGSNLYAFGEQYGKVVYFIADTPNLKQTKDTSDSTKYNKNYEEYTLDICISHNWDAGVIVTAPTYKNEGTKKYTCTNCGETKTETIAKLVCTEHVWDAGVVVTAPTYTSTGTKKYTCENCGETKTETIAKLVCTEHVWDAGVVVTAPTYTSTGTKKYTCENCGETKTETIAKLVCTDHAWDAGVIVTAPTYTNTGTKKYTCENCGETKTETIARLVCTKHAWDAGVVTIQPTYKTEGTRKYTCTNCGETKTELVDKLVCTEHAWDAGEVTKQPTYKTEGTRKYTCTNCGETKTETIARLVCTNHAWDAGVVTKQPTYKTEGTRKYTCTNCGETKTETIAKLVCTTHAWDNGTVTKKATYTATGVRKYTCKTCGAAKQVTIAKLKLTKVTVKAAQQTSAVKLTWNRSAGASGYKIYRRTAKGRYVCIKTVKSGTTSYVDKTVKSGNRYYYCVKAYNGNVLSGYTEASILYIKAPVVTVRKSAQGVKLSWKKSAGAKKYIVYRKTPTGKYRAVKTVTAKTLSWTDKTAKKGQTYYYIVKAVNNKTYSAASPQKRIKR